jgi:hypothetical protein
VIELERKEAKMIYIFYGLLGWWLIGVGVCAYLDEYFYHGDLMKWAEDFPRSGKAFGVFLASMIFPLVIYLHLRRGDND